MSLNKPAKFPTPFCEQHWIAPPMASIRWAFCVQQQLLSLPMVMFGDAVHEPHFFGMKMILSMSSSLASVTLLPNSEV